MPIGCRRIKGLVVWLRGVPEWIVTEMTAAFHGVGGLPLEDLHYRSATAFEMIPYVPRERRTDMHAGRRDLQRLR